MRILQWHRLFGLALKDLFLGTCYEVELEKDLSERQQFLDVVVVRKEDSGLPAPDLDRLPDGLEDLRAHNLLSFKSMHEPLDRFAIVELIGHMVAYAKIVAGDQWRSFCENELSLLAVSTRKPVTAPPGCPDVYELEVQGFRIRCIVLSEAPMTETNALWNLFSARDEKIEFGTLHYHWKSPDTSTIVRRLTDEYALEGIPMPYTLEDYLNEVVPELVDDLKPEGRKAVANRLTKKERLEGLSEEELLEELSEEKIREYLRSLEGNRPDSD